MVRTPEIDSRRRAELREHIKAIAPYYLDEWDPERDDAGAALVELFGGMAGDLIERLDRAPRKHQIALYDALGFDRLIPQPATVPVSFQIDPDAPANVPISPGTEVEAAGDEDEQIFRFGSDEAFETTPAQLTHVFSVDPRGDRLVAHHDAIGGITSSTLFTDDNVQENVLYIGDPEWLDLSGGSSIVLDLEGSVNPNALVWEYFGNTEDDDESWIELEKSKGEIEWTANRLTLTPPGAVVETDVNGIESFWIRCMVPPDTEEDGLYESAFDLLQFRDGHENTVDADGLYANDIPQPADDGDSYPFGAIPQQRDAFYIACREAFTKTGANVRVEFEEVEGDDPVEDVRLSWEYFDGSSWRVLEVENGDDPFDQGDIEFTVPGDIESTSVFGQDGVWIRVRLVKGAYVNVTYTQQDTSSTSDPPKWESSRSVDGDPPSFDSVSITFSAATAEVPRTLLAANGLEYSDNMVDEEPPYRPFSRLPDAEQTTYFGFDGRLEGGPVQWYFDLDDREYPGDFTPRVRWEYLVDAGTDEWAPLITRDDTAGFTRSGIVSLAFPAGTEATRRFGENRHWLRARVRGEAFDRAESGGSGTDAPGTTTESEDGTASLEPCRPFLETVPGGSGRAQPAPEIVGVYPNTGLARNVRIVEDEILGSSDGSPNIDVAVSRPPTIEIEVWIDETTALTSQQVERLQADRPDDIIVETDSSGDVTAAWIKWKPVEELTASGETDRHYVLDRVDGTITFGDGTVGRIPPHGQDNILASYRTGGGSAGNIEPGTVEDVSTAIPHVDVVSNPIGGSGGADAESMSAVLDRAPRVLRDRDRAVTAVDYERIAMDAARGLAEVRCLRGMNRQGEREPGWVTVLIVPDERRETPIPSVGLKEQVEQEVSKRAPLHLVKRNRLVVRGPTYVPLHVEATVVADDVPSLGTFETEIETNLRTLLHPLSGQDGEGWRFGELPTISDVIAAIEAHDGVDHVPALRLHYEGTHVTESITKGEVPPDVSPDVLIRGGDIELVVRPRRRVCPEDPE